MKTGTTYLEVMQSMVCAACLGSAVAIQPWNHVADPGCSGDQMPLAAACVQPGWPGRMGQQPVWWRVGLGV